MKPAVVILLKAPLGDGLKDCFDTEENYDVIWRKLDLKPISSYNAKSSIWKEMRRAWHRWSLFVRRIRD
jgi:hypothetical protein